MKSAMKRAAGGVALTMVLIRGFCGGGVFFGYLGSECLVIDIEHRYRVSTFLPTFFLGERTKGKQVSGKSSDTFSIRRRRCLDQRETRL